MQKILNNTFVWTMFICIALTAVPSHALPPDPDNAALLYYQGFLSLPQLSQEEREHLSAVARGKVTPDDKVREDIFKSGGAIHFAEAAVKVPDCQWGIQFSEGFDALMPQLAQIRFMTFVLVADARVRAADGDYQGALERCLMTETFAYHIGNDTFISYLMTISVRGMAYKCMQDVIGQAAGDAELLQWLQKELATSPISTFSPVPLRIISPVQPLLFERETVTDLMRMENVEKLSRIMSESKKDKAAEIVRQVNAEILKKSRQIYTERMNSVISIWNSPMPYEQAYSRLEELSNKFDSNDPAAEVAQAFMPAINKIFLQKTWIDTQYNAIKAGIEILLDRAKEGKLPDALPPDLPKDAFSGEDFEYKKTKEGFILHCRDKDLSKNELYQYEFKLSK
jgi:hypothetical protein